MATAKTIPLARHPYADGSYKRMLVDGTWVDAASGKRFESRNPATGEVLATVAEGDAEDINRAVAAARKAFEGPWSKFKPYQRQQLLLKLADLVEQHFDELSALDTLGPNVATIVGTDGRIDIDAVWYTPTTFRVLNSRGDVIESFDEPVEGRGMQFQAFEAERLIRAGEISSPLLSPEESVSIMETMDEIRRQIGLVYPGE